MPRAGGTPYAAPDAAGFGAYAAWNARDVRGAAPMQQHVFGLEK